MLVTLWNIVVFSWVQVRLVDGIQVGELLRDEYGAASSVREMAGLESRSVTVGVHRTRGSPTVRPVNLKRNAQHVGGATFGLFFFSSCAIPRTRLKHLRVPSSIVRVKRFSFLLRRIILKTIEYEDLLIVRLSSGIYPS